jgi:hypothetical protein
MAGFSLQSLATQVGWIAGFLVALGVIGKAVQLVWRALRRFGQMAEEVLGDPDARPPVPSLVQRVIALELAQQKLIAELHKPNVRQARR